MAAFGRRTPLPEAASEARRLMAAELHARGFRDVFESADPIEELRLRLHDGTQLPLRPLAERCAVEPRRIWSALTRHYVTAVLEMYQNQRLAITAEPGQDAAPVPAGPPSAADSALTRQLLATMPAPASVAVDLPSPVSAAPAPEAHATPIVAAPVEAAPVVAAPVEVAPIVADPVLADPVEPTIVSTPAEPVDVPRTVATPPGVVPTVSRLASAPPPAVVAPPTPSPPPARIATAPTQSMPPIPDLGPAPARVDELEGDRFSVDAVESAPTRELALRPPHPGPPPPSAHLEALLGAVRARLLPDPPVGEDSWHYARRVAPGLHVGLELLIGRTPRLLLDSEIAQMPFTLEQLFHAGWRASAAEVIDEDREVAPGIRMLSGASHYVATKAANLPALEHRFGSAPHGVVIAVPHRHALLFHPVWRDSVLVIEEMAQLVDSLATGDPETTPGGGLSSSLYFWSDGRLERIDLGAEPTGAFATALATALI